MDFFSEDIEFLKELLSNDKVELYLLHEKYRLSPAQMARTIKKFEKLDLIIIKDDRISLKDKGRKWIFEKRNNLFLKEKDKYWKKVPEEMEQEKIAINSLYKPKRSKIDNELFKNIEDGK